MQTKPILLTRQIIADMKHGEEFVDSNNPGLRVRCTGSTKVFFYRSRSTDGALREIKLGEFGALTLADARTELAKRRLTREQGIDPQIEKRKARDEQRQLREVTRQVDYLIVHMVEDYIREVLSKQKRGGESARLLRKEFVPIWRDFASFTWPLFDKDVHNFGFRITPLQSFFEGLGKGIKSAADVAAGDGDEIDAKNIILGVSYLLGLPGYQAWRTISGIEAVAGDAAGIQAVLMGPPKS